MDCCRILCHCRAAVKRHQVVIFQFAGNQSWKPRQRQLLGIDVAACDRISPRQTELAAQLVVVDHRFNATGRKFEHHDRGQHFHAQRVVGRRFFGSLAAEHA